MSAITTGDLLAELPALPGDGRPMATRAAVAIAVPIRAGTWPVGARLPTCAAIAVRLGASVDAVRTAVNLLISHSLVRRERGGAAFVTNEQAERDRWR